MVMPPQPMIISAGWMAQQKQMRKMDNTSKDEGNKVDDDEGDDREAALHAASNPDQEMADPNILYTTMAVDGIVISSQHCAYGDCISELAN